MVEPSVRKWRWFGVLALGPLFGANLLTCSYDISCGSSSVAFVLPAPEDELAMHVFLCVEPGRDVEWTLWATFDAEQLRSTELVLEVDDPVAGPLESTAFDSIELTFDDRHCDEGLIVVVRREGEMDAGPLAGWIDVYAEQEEASVCKSTWQRSDET